MINRILQTGAAIFIPTGVGFAWIDVLQKYEMPYWVLTTFVVIYAPIQAWILSRINNYEGN